MTFEDMTSSRPYLLRALNEWIVDNSFTPHIVVDANRENTVVPREYVESGKIVLNISPFAVQNLVILNDFVSFSARFSGKAMNISVPISAVMAIYAKENGQGMVFAEQVSAEPTSAPQQEIEKEKANERPSLTLVK